MLRHISKVGSDWSILARTLGSYDLHLSHAHF